MITVKIPESELNKVRTAMRNKASDSARKVEKVIGSIAYDLEGNIKESLNQKATGETYEIPTIPGRKGGPTRMHTASEPGKPPAKQYGFLIFGIRAEKIGNRLTGRVRSNAEYSRGLEFGTPRVQARPFMRPAAEKIQPKFTREIKKIFK